MGNKVYPPQPWIHDADCPYAPRGLLLFKASSLPQLYPLARPHTCFSRDTVTRNCDCVAEQVDYEPHPYVRSTIWPSDATGPLCGTCRGNHAEPAVPARRAPRNDRHTAPVTASPPSLIVPSGTT